MSGGGVWWVGHSLRAPAHVPLLAGVAIEWYPRARTKHILATRIQPVIAAAREEYSDVAASLRILA